MYSIEIGMKYGLPILIIGVLYLVAGALSVWRDKQDRQKEG